MKYLPPMTLREDYFDEIERRINSIFYDALFRPLFKTFADYGRSKQLANSTEGEAIAAAIRSGKIYYEAGKIYGAFSARISREAKELGGIFDSRSGHWTLPTLTAEIQMAIAQADAVSKKMFSEVISVLDSVDVNKQLELLPLAPAYEKTLTKMNQDFTRITQKIAVAPQITDQAKLRISQSWGENLDLYIKDWTDEKVLELRQMITSNSMRGQRAENMVTTIMQQYGVSQRKAKFLARQETSLMMSNFQKERYKDVGVKRYKWSTSHDVRVRKSHRELNGKIFFFDNPPPSGTKGEKGNPGEPFGCRCVAIPIVDL